jgi:AraC family transcriptional regulator
MTSSFVPEMTSAEALEMYPAGLKIAGGEGDAWRDVCLSIFSLDTQAEQFPMPAVAEPFIVWVMSGEAETMEREPGQQEWLVHQVNAGSLYLTAAAVPYEFSWRRISSEPFQVMLITFSLPLLERALTDVYGQKANTADLRDVSGFQDAVLVSLLECLRQEVKRPQASALYVQGIAQAIAVHLARYYAIFSEVKRDDASTLPRYILKKIIAWMTDHLADEFSLARLAQQAHMSEFHFNRLFKRSVGVPPSRYQIKLRLDAARRLLRETDLTIIEIANRVGYSNPSHFAQLFRKENGLSPSAYRRQP